MFVSLRDIAFAKGRVALVATVVAMITILLIMLTGLTNGLGKQNTAALESFGADRVVLAGGSGNGQDPTFTTSRIDQGQLNAWRQDESVTHVEPLVVSQTQVDVGGVAASTAIMGLPTNSYFTRELAAVDGASQPQAGELVVSKSVAEDLGAAVGDPVTVAGQDLTVAGIAEDEYYSHTPVAWTTNTDALNVSHQPRGTLATAILADVDTGAQASAVSEQLDHRANTVSSTTRGAFNALPAYSSEHGSLVSMQAFLYVISALVTVSFITVWTVQRTRDIAVLGALGASRGYLFKDALGQAAVVVTAGAALGLLIGAGGGLLLSTLVSAVPFHLSAFSALAPAAGVVVLGVLGSVIAVRRVTSIDPMIALGGN